MSLFKKTDPGFSLIKYYLDCIDEHGNVFIGYSAVLKWKKIKLNYANVLSYDNAAGATMRTTVRAQPPPDVTENLVTWSADKLPAQGSWESIDAPIEESLLNSDIGAIKWRCYQPRAHASVIVDDNKPINGLGYTERLEMTIKPWKLPFGELRWGRFLSPQDTIVWINWSGESNLNLLFYNNELIQNATVSDESINFDHGKQALAFTDTVILRKGSLISTALANLPIITRVFPKKILNTYECKWRSRGFLKNEDGTSSTGWVIHEVVQWK